MISKKEELDRLLDSFGSRYKLTLCLYPLIAFLDNGGEINICHFPTERIKSIVTSLKTLTKNADRGATTISSKKRKKGADAEIIWLLVLDRTQGWNIFPISHEGTTSGGALETLSEEEEQAILAFFAYLLKELASCSPHLQTKEKEHNPWSPVFELEKALLTSGPRATSLFSFPLAPVQPKMDEADPVSILEKKGYKTVTSIGKGSFGEVFSAIDSKGNPVAWKLILPRYINPVLSNGELFVMSIAATLSPFLTPLLSWDLSSAGLFIEMPLATQNLQSVIKKGGISMTYFFSIIQSILCGISHLHQLGLMHLDLKPDNVLEFLSLNGKKEYKLSDFGLAHVTDGIDRIDTGTTFYSDPISKRSPASDMWALGILVLESLFLFFKDPKEKTIYGQWKKEYKSSADFAKQITTLSPGAKESDAIRGLAIYRKAAKRTSPFPFPSESSEKGAIWKLFELVGKTLWMEPEKRATAKELIRDMKISCPLLWTPIKVGEKKTSPCGLPPSPSSSSSNKSSSFVSILPQVENEYHAVCSILFPEKDPKDMEQDTSLAIFFALLALHSNPVQMKQLEKEFGMYGDLTSRIMDGMRLLYSLENSKRVTDALFKEAQKKTKRAIRRTRFI